MSPGQIAFEAYNISRGGKTHDGKPTPPWTELGEGVRGGWEAAGEAANAHGKPSAREVTVEVLRGVAGVAALVGGALPAPFATAVRIVGAAAGAASVGLDQGLTDDQVIARIHRVSRLDVSADDAAIDAAVAGKPHRP